MCSKDSLLDERHRPCCIWRTCSYRLCMVATLWVLTRMSAICWFCCCDVGGSCGTRWSLRCTSARSSAMTFAFKRRLSRFLTTSSLFCTNLASSSASSSLATPFAPGSVPAGSGRPHPLFCSPFAVTHTSFFRSSCDLPVGC